MSVKLNRTICFYFLLLFIFSFVLCSPSSAQKKNGNTITQKGLVTQNNVVIVFLLDDSKSMASSDPKGLRFKGIREFIEFLSPGVNVAIITFSDKANVIAQVNIEIEEDRKRLVEALANVRSKGRETNIDSGIELGFKTLSSYQDIDEKVIILLTDGKSWPSPYQNTHERHITENCKIYGIGLSEDADMSLLKRICRDTCGTPYLSSHADDLPKIYIDLMRKLFPHRDTIFEKMNLQLTNNMFRKEIFWEGGKDLYFMVDYDANDTVELEVETPERKKIEARQGRHVFDKSYRTVDDPHSGYAGIFLEKPTKGKYVINLKSQTGQIPLLLVDGDSIVSIRADTGKEIYKKEEAVRLDIKFSKQIVEETFSIYLVMPQDICRDLEKDLTGDGSGKNFWIHNGDTEIPGRYSFRIKFSAKTLDGIQFTRDFFKTFAVADIPLEFQIDPKLIDFGALYPGDKKTVMIKIKSSEEVIGSIELSEYATSFFSSSRVRLFPGEIQEIPMSILARGIPKGHFREKLLLKNPETGEKVIIESIYEILPFSWIHWCIQHWRGLTLTLGFLFLVLLIIIAIIFTNPKPPGKDTKNEQSQSRSNSLLES